MQTEDLQKLLEQVKAGDVTIDEAVEKLRHLPFEDLGFACIDHHRQIRCGFPEVIYCPGKTVEQITTIFTKLAEKGNNVLATRAEPNVFEALSKTNKFHVVILKPNLAFSKWFPIHCSVIIYEFGNPLTSVCR